MQLPRRPKYREKQKLMNRTRFTLSEVQILVIQILLEEEINIYSLLEINAQKIEGAHEF